MDNALGNHPVDSLPSHMILERFIKVNIDGLAEGSASAGDVLHLHPKLLDYLDNQCHHVALVHVED